MTDENSRGEQFSDRAAGDYGRVRRRAWFREAVAKLAGRSNQLLSYEAVRKSLKLGGPIYRGVKTVPVAQIIGSVDRYRDFDDVFLPKLSSTANRWKSIARAFYSDVDLPPVRLYKVGDAYFVMDGHHRVSVAREQGIDFIDAEVQEVVSRVPVSAGLKAEDLKILHEYRRFLERTKLDEIRPGQHIRFTVTGGYQQIIEHIATHRHYMQLEQQREVSDAAAVADWYDQVYLPLVEVIRANQVLDDFPGRTESDLYFWIIEHLYFLRETEKDTSLEEAAEDYADQYSEKSIKRLVRSLTQAFGNGDEDVPLEVVKAELAREKFLAATHLAELRPGADMVCTSDLDYGRLRDHIKKHRYYMGLELKRDVNADEAVTHWYDEVYQPIVAAIRENELRSEFPDKTETELYLSIVQYLDQLRQAGEVSAAEAAVDYAAQFKQHPIKKILGGLLSVFVGGEAAPTRSVVPPATAEDAAAENAAAEDAAAEDAAAKEDAAKGAGATSQNSAGGNDHATS